MSTISDLDAVSSEIDSLHERRRPFADKKKSLEDQMRGINEALRIKRMSRDEYQSAIKKKKQINDLIRENDKFLVAINAEIKKWNRLYDKVRIDAKKETYYEAPVLTHRLVAPKLEKLRRKYIDFSEDQTRISSMRIVASQIVADLTDLLNELDSTGDES